MKLEATVSPITSLGEGVWIAQVPPESLRGFARDSNVVGETSVVLLPSDDLPQDNADRLVFDPASIRVLTIGRSNRAIFLYDLGAPVPDKSRNDSNRAFGSRVFSDDDRLNHEFETLPAELTKLGRELVTAVRAAHPGRFERTESGKYIYRPNFWTIRVQPRDRSLAITVYGRGSALGSHGSLTVLPDQNSYSRFKVSSQSQFDDAFEVITRSAKLKEA